MSNGVIWCPQHTYYPDCEYCKTHDTSRPDHPSYELLPVLERVEKLEALMRKEKCEE